MRNKFSVSAIIEENVTIGEDTFIWYFTHVMSGVKIGRKCSVGEKSFIGRGVLVGDNVKIGNNVNIYEGAIIKDNVFIGNNVSFTNVRKPKAQIKAKKFLNTLIEDGVSIGANATIVGGVKIGKDSVVADGSVVIKNIPDGVFVAGNPATIVKKENHE